MNACQYCSANFKRSTKVGWVYRIDDDLPSISHWDCLAGHKDVNIIGIKRANARTDTPMAFSSLTPRQQRAARGVATRMLNGPIIGRGATLSGMGGCAYNSFA